MGVTRYLHADTDEVPTIGHALESSHYCADTSNRFIVFSTVEPVKVINQSQPLSLSPTRTGLHGGWMSHMLRCLGMLRKSYA